MNWPAIFASRKYQAAAVGTAGGSIGIVLICLNKSFDLAAKQSMIEKILNGMWALWGAAVVMNGFEDGLEKHKPGPTSPLQVNANTSDSTQANVPAALPPSDPPSAPPSSVVIPKTPVKPSGGATAVTVSTNPTYTVPSAYVPTRIPKGQK